MKLLSSHLDYQFFGKWATNNSNCSDPKQLLESAAMKFEDVITQVKFQYWNSDESTEYHSSINQFKDWYHFDTQKYGRCFTLQPSKEHTQLGIKQIELRLQANSYISIHPLVTSNTQHDLLTVHSDVC